MFNRHARCARMLRAAFVFLLLILSATPGTGATADSLQASSAVVPFSPASTPARLVLNNREIVEFRAAFMGYTPEHRAEAALGRVRDAVRSLPRNQMEVQVDARPVNDGWVFYVGDRWVFGLTAGDCNALNQETLEELVAATRTKLQDAVTAAVEQRTTSRLVRSIAFSLLATVLLVVLMRALLWVTRAVTGRLQERLLHSRAVTDTHIPLLRQVGTLARGLLRLAGGVIALVLVDLWLTFVLKQFPYTYPWGDQIDDFLFRVLGSIGLGILRAIPNLLILGIIVLIGRFVDRWVRLFFAAVKEGRIDPPGVDSDTAIPVQRLVLLLVWVVTVAIAYPFIPGSQGIAFKGLSVLLGLMVSLGSSNVVSQAASGYMIMFSKALRTNDYVRIGEYEGTIMSVGMLSTKLRTPRDEEINVPNAFVVSTTVKNYTRLNLEVGAPVTTTVTIGYNAPWRQVHAMLLDAAAQTAGLRKDPPPRVLQSSLSDFYVEYTLVARLEVAQMRAAVLSELHANIQDAFNVHGVQIMSPHYEGDPEGKVWVPKEKWYQPPARDDEHQTGPAKGAA